MILIINTTLKHLNFQVECLGFTYVDSTKAKSIQQSSPQHAAYEAKQRWEGAGSSWGKKRHEENIRKNLNTNDHVQFLNWQF